MTKYRGQIRVTNEWIANKLNLPEDTKITNVSYNADREIVHLYLISDTENEYTIRTMEGGEIYQFAAPEEEEEDQDEPNTSHPEK